MVGRPEFLKWQGKDLSLRVRVQARASRDEIVGIHDDQLKIRITSPPADGQANAHLTAFLAKLFGVPKSNVSVTAGTTGRTKVISIHAPTRFPDFVPRTSK